MIVGFLLLSLIHNAIPKKWRNDNSLSWVKMTMLDVTYRQLFQGVAAGITFLCALFLFAIIEQTTNGNLLMRLMVYDTGGNMRVDDRK